MDRTERVFKFNQVLAELESTFGRINVPHSVMMSRVSDDWLEFYYRKLVEKE